ncbi:MAG: hypothetical protein LBG58_08645 [Planctomycetaceae bacterium]|jgi:hypothetical protein|nr:hypothetical protein [Planctomycetaceae bacterium]
MFNVTRHQPGPDCSTDYRSKDVILALKKIFNGKCYLCEDKVTDPVVEHFIPHEGDPVKKFNWNNLYYACRRCNSIKGVTTDILDCCDAAINVSDAIKCLCPSVPDNNVVVEAQNCDEKTQNTANLLGKCYNEKNTGIRGISREALHEKLFEHYCKFIDDRRKLKNLDSSQQEKESAKEHLTQMKNIAYPFSAFWKWHILSDAFLNEQFKGIQ